ncbi:MAG: PqqD family protein [Thermoleophilia bacterium]
MTELQGTFAPDPAEVVAKVIDGELIVIRLDDGTYYAMGGAGAAAWTLLAAGHDLDAVAATLAGRYGIPLERAREDVATLVRELLAERLLAPAPAPASPGATTFTDPAGAYEPPRLEVYRDMGNLLALDPPTPGIDDLTGRP